MHDSTLGETADTWVAFPRRTISYVFLLRIAFSDEWSWTWLVKLVHMVYWRRIFLRTSYVWKEMILLWSYRTCWWCTSVHSLLVWVRDVLDVISMMPPMKIELNYPRGVTLYLVQGYGISSVSIVPWCLCLGPAHVYSEVMGIWSATCWPRASAHIAMSENIQQIDLTVKILLGSVEECR